MTYFINSPLEQFSVNSLISLQFPIFDYINFSLTNLGLYTMITVFVTIMYHIYSDNNTRIIPNRWSISVETSFASLHSMVKSQIGIVNEVFFPFIYSLFFFILFANFNGNIPYGFTITTSIMISLGFSFMIFLGVTFMGLWIHKFNFFSFFVPAGAPKMLLPMMIPIEIISYLSRAISLGVRLFANTTAGHSLMKILASFIAPMFTSSIFMSFITIIPFTIFISVVALEVAVSFIQAFVFCILTASYIKDAIDLH